MKRSITEGSNCPIRIFPTRSKAIHFLSDVKSNLLCFPAYEGTGNVQGPWEHIVLHLHASHWALYIIQIISILLGRAAGA